MKQAGRLRRIAIAAYALPALPGAMILFPSYAILPGFYAQHTAIPLSLIGMILLVGRVFDAVIDPAVGWLTDRYRTRFGQRIPWIVLGGIVSAVAVRFLYVPPQDAQPSYMLVWFLVFYTGFTLIEIPHKAWGTDIARGYEERTAIATSLGVAFSVGTLLFAALPFLPFSDVRTYGQPALSAASWMVVVLLPLTIGAAIALTPRSTPAATQATLRPDALLASVRGNRPLQHFLAIFLLTGLGQGIFYALVFLFIGSFPDLAGRFAWFLLADAVVTLAAVPVWSRLILLLEKHRAWAAGTWIGAAAIAGMALVPGDQPHAFALLLGLVALRAAGGAVVYVAPNALLGDVVDHELLRTRTNRAGNFHALVTLFAKANGAAGGGVGFLLLGAVGYQATGPNPPEALSGMRAVALLLPALLLVASGLVAWRFRLTRARHEIVRRRLAARAA